MAVKKTGISRDLIIHPGETIADVLEERGITQAELAAQTGVSAAYVSNVIAGKKDISAKFALSLEYALGVPKSFWLNLQANYDAEMLDYNESLTITEEERQARASLSEIVKYLRKLGKLPVGESKDDSILSLRKVLQFSNISNLKDIVPAGAFRMAAGTAVDPYVLGAWIRMCQLIEEDGNISSRFDPVKTDDLIHVMKSIMLANNANVQKDLRDAMADFGIDFSIVRNFRGAPVQGYITQKNNGIYQLVLTIRGAFADIFWFSLFHEVGHIVNGDIGKTTKFVDMGANQEKERKADLFASDKLLSQKEYEKFVDNRQFDIDSIQSFAASQHVMPYIVIGRLQREKKLSYSAYSGYKLRYKWEK